MVLQKNRHIHLPKLEDYGFIRCNGDSNEVSEVPNFGKIQPLSHLLNDHGDDPPDDWL
jgi:hypothetical protein